MILVLDPARTSVVLHTFTEGFFSRLAHDLEIEAREVSGELDDEAERAIVHVPVAALVVAGVVKGGVVDPSVLAPSDRHDIEARIRSDVLAGASTVDVTVTRIDRGFAFDVLSPRGHHAIVTSDATLERAPDGLSIVASGALRLALDALGIPPVKGPLNAFRVSSRVEVSFRVAFRAPP